MPSIGSVNGGVPMSRVRGVVGAGQVGRTCRGLTGPSFYLVLAHLARERVPVHAERVGGPGEAAVFLAEHAHDEPLLELAQRIVEPNAFVDHLLHEPLETIGNHSSSRPVRRRNASTYFSRVFATTSSGSDGTGGCLFQLMRSR